VFSLQLTTARHRHRKDTEEDNSDPDYDYDFKDHADEDQDDADELPEEVELTENERRAAEPRYEVIEIIDDIPNPEQYRPVIPNYAIDKPLNLAVPNDGSNRNSVNENRKRGNRRVFTKHSEKYTHKDFFDFEEVIPTIKESFDGIKTGFVNGVKHLGRGVAQAPGIVIDKIHSKGTDFVKTISGFFYRRGREN
ncbi:hypothetical protein ACJJTC_005768, partial [Scirpophaga incertulas]